MQITTLIHVHYAIGDGNAPVVTRYQDTAVTPIAADSLCESPNSGSAVSGVEAGKELGDSFFV